MKGKVVQMIKIIKLVHGKMVDKENGNKKQF